MPSRVRTRIEDVAAGARLNGRERTQFRRGNRAASGRRPDPLRRALVEAASPEDVADVMRRLITSAKKGNVRAAGLLFAYLFGRPREMATTTSIALPALDNAEACARAASSIATRAAAGELSLGDAATLASLVSFAGDQHRIREIEAALLDLQARMQPSERWN